MSQIIRNKLVSMVIKMRGILYCVLLLLICGCARTPEKGSENKSPKELTIEYIRDTKDVFIIDSQPEFGWVVPKSSVSQTAFQILVATTKEFLNANNGDVWDSGIVKSKASSNIEFKGKPLKSGDVYYWKVRIWDVNNKESSFSKVQSFIKGDKNKGITTSNSIQIDRIQPVYIHKLDNTTCILDFGKDAFSNLEFLYSSKVSDTLVVHIGEQLTENRINREPQGSIRYQMVKVPVNPNTRKYSLQIKPDKRNTKIGAILLPDSVPVLMPFRYVEIENVKEPIKKSDFSQLAYHGYWDNSESHFSSSDSILNQVWDLCKYSIKATTFTGLYVDGDRERIPYEADAYLNQLSHYATDREYAMARSTIEYFMEHPTWPTEWQLHVALMFHADYMYTGDTELIEEYYDMLKHKVLVDLRREDGLISVDNVTPQLMKKLGFKDPSIKLKDIFDWPPAQKDTGWKLATKEGERDGFVFTSYNTVVNCLYYRNIEIMAEFANLLGKTDDYKFYKELEKQVRNSINTALFDSAKGIYLDGEGTSHASLHANMMAMAFNIVPNKNKKSVTDFIKSRGMACSVYGAQYLLETLYNANEGVYALALMNSTENRSWYNMIRVGATMTMEAWDMKYKPNSDWNHAWGAVPANIISRGLWGITPKEPGYSVARIKPQLGELRKSSINIPTIKGVIKAEYVKEENSESYSIEIPGNMSAEFVRTSGNRIVLDGNELSEEDNKVILDSGKHLLQVRH